MPYPDLPGRVAIVTGAGRGLGRAMALGLARAGVHVVATAAREESEISGVADAAAGAPGRIVPVLADATREADAARVVEAATRTFGRLDILVNNAGRGMKYVSDKFLTEPTRFWETDAQAWRLVIDTNVNGPFLMARAAAPVMIAAGWGRIVNISMNQETMHRAGFSPYGPSKAALESETIIWSQDLAGSGVSVNALLPGGATLTGMIPESVDEAIRSRLLAPDIVVAPLLWLCSAGADGVTGKRFVATRWSAEFEPQKAAQAAMEGAGWP